MGNEDQVSFASTIKPDNIWKYKGQTPGNDTLDDSLDNKLKGDMILKLNENSNKKYKSARKGTILDDIADNYSAENMQSDEDEAEQKRELDRDQEHPPELA